jgi:hypothetical protein
MTVKGFKRTDGVLKTLTLKSGEVVTVIVHPTIKAPPPTDCACGRKS